MEISNWFKGFEKGIARLSPEERSAFFSECGKNCVNGGTLSVYKKLYEDAKGNMDVFFQMAEDQAEVGYWIARPFWGDFFPLNPASGRVMEKCGFVDTGEETLCPNLEVGSDRPVRVMKLQKKEQGR